MKSREFKCTLISISLGHNTPKCIQFPTEYRGVPRFSFYSFSSGKPPISEPSIIKEGKYHLIRISVGICVHLGGERLEKSSSIDNFKVFNPFLPAFYDYVRPSLDGNEFPLCLIIHTTAT